MYRQNYILDTPVSSDFSFSSSNVLSREMGVCISEWWAHSQTSSGLCSLGQWSPPITCSSVTNNREWMESQLPNQVEPGLVVPHWDPQGIKKASRRAPMMGTNVYSFFFVFLHKWLSTVLRGLSTVAWSQRVTAFQGSCRESMMDSGSQKQGLPLRVLGPSRLNSLGLGFLHDYWEDSV